MANLLTLNVLEGYDRPVVSLKDGISCLIDTGANIPVWTRGAEMLLNAFHAEKLKDRQFLLSGFGKKEEIVDAYRISDFVLEGSLGDRNREDRIIFKSMIVACTERPFLIANMILPATAFSHMNYMVKNIGVEDPVVEIYHEKTEYSVSPIYSSVDNKIIERAYSFANG